MKTRSVLLLAALFILFCTSPVGWCRQTPPSPTAPAVAPPDLSLDDIMDRIEKRYADAAFSANFFQTATMKAMAITDTASGSLMVKSPGKMRWTYETPERQVIVTDGEELWVYRPDENQVMVGKASVFFGNGKGAGFLSDIKLLRKAFDVTLETPGTDTEYRLKLLPREPKFELSAIYLLISKTTFDVSRIITYNAYDDETLIELSRIRKEPKMDDSLFRFKIPQGVDILQLNE